MKAALLLACLVAAVRAGGPLAVVLSSEGAVKMTTPKGERSPKAGDLVLSNGRIATGSDGHLRLRLLADRSVVDLLPGSSLSLDVLERSDRTLRRAFLLSGGATYSLSQGAEDFRAETRTSVASGSLAQFSVLTGIDGRTEISVTDGTLAICNPETGDHTTAGAGATVASGWDGLGEPRASGTPVSEGDSTFAVEIRLVDPASGGSSRLRYGLSQKR